MSVYGFDETDAKRIGKVVRLVERDPTKIRLGGPDRDGAAPGVRLMLGKAGGTVEPYATQVVTVYSGESLTATAVTVIARNTLYPLVDTQATACISNNGFGWHVVEGVQQLWCGQVDEEFLIDEEKTVLLHGCEQEITAVNEITPVHRPSGAEVVVAYTDDKWRVVNAETYHTRPGTYDAETAWLNGANKTVKFNTGGEATVRNDGPSIGVWAGTARDCIACYEYGQWSLVEAETYYTRRATYDASSEWLNGASATVQLTNGGGAVTAVNNGPSIGVWSGTARDCVVSYEDNTWVLHEAETYYVRRGTFSGEWDKNTTKTVTLTNGGSVTANNLFGDVGVSGETKNCAVAYEDGTWFLIAAECG